MQQVFPRLVLAHPCDRTGIDRCHDPAGFCRGAQHDDPRQMVAAGSLHTQGQRGIVRQVSINEHDVDVACDHHASSRLRRVDRRRAGDTGLCLQPFRNGVGEGALPV